MYKYLIMLDIPHHQFFKMVEYAIKDLATKWTVALSNSLFVVSDKPHQEWVDFVSKQVERFGGKAFVIELKDHTCINGYAGQRCWNWLAENFKTEDAPPT